MKAFYSSLFPLNLPPDHRFPMRKYSRLRELLLAEGSLELHEAPPVAHEDLLRVHDPEYVRRVEAGELSARELRRLGFPWSPELVARAFASVGASLAAARAALTDGFGANLAGGTHHADRDSGSGYCVFNDFAVTAAALLAHRQAERVLILDLDVHQGNGTARLMAGLPGVFTCSLHGRDNFPYRKERSDLDVELPTGTGDEAYLAALDGALSVVRQRFGRPDIVLYLAGADPHEADRFGKLRLTTAGLARRDARVFEELAPEVPVAVAMGGGYGRDLETVARIHSTTITLGAAAFRAPSAAPAAPPSAPAPAGRS